MSVTQYIGARYMPLFAEPAEWDNSRAYEPLTIVLYKGNSYTSKQSVPIGASIDDTVYWAETGNYNSQVEQYRIEVKQVRKHVDDSIKQVNDSLNQTTSEVDAKLAKTVSDVDAKLAETVDNVDVKLAAATQNNLLVLGDEWVTDDVVTKLGAMFDNVSNYSRPGVKFRNPVDENSYSAQLDSAIADTAPGGRYAGRAYSKAIIVGGINDFKAGITFSAGFAQTILDTVNRIRESFKNCEVHLFINNACWGSDATSKTAVNSFLSGHLNAYPIADALKSIPANMHYGLTYMGLAISDFYGSDGITLGSHTEIVAPYIISCLNGAPSFAISQSVTDGSATVKISATQNSLSIRFNTDLARTMQYDIDVRNPAFKTACRFIEAFNYGTLTVFGSGKTYSIGKDKIEVQTQSGIPTSLYPTATVQLPS